MDTVDRERYQQQMQLIDEQVTLSTELYSTCHMIAHGRVILWRRQLIWPETMGCVLISIGGGGWDHQCPLPLYSQYIESHRRWKLDVFWLVGMCWIL